MVTSTLVTVVRYCAGTFFLYGVGYAVPLLRADLRLTDSVAGLHGSAVAVGLIGSGIVGDAIARRVGAAAAARLAVGLLAASAAILAFTPVVWLTLVGCVALGFAAGGIMSVANQELGTAGGRRAVVLLARMNVASLVTALSAPLAIAFADGLGIGGRVGLLAPLPIVAVTEWLSRGRGGEVVADASAAPRAGDGGAAADRLAEPSPGRLPAAYWRAWLVLTVAIAIEFAIVFWSSSLITVRTGASTAEATTAAAAFVGGMILARVALASRFGSTSRRTALMSVAFALVGVGIVGAWLADSVLGSALALAVAGLGVGPLYPLGIARALAAAPGAALTAAARATFASGLAILTAPFALSLMADQVGLANAWPGLAAMAAIGIVLLLAGPKRGAAAA